MVHFTPEGVAFPPLNAEQTMEALESLAVRFRRLHLTNDRSTFSNVLYRFRQRAVDAGSADVVDWLGGLGARRRALLKRWTLLGDQGLSPEVALDRIFNQEMFHHDRDENFSTIEHWRFFIAGAVYEQIATFSGLYMELAIALDVVLREPE